MSCRFRLLYVSVFVVLAFLASRGSASDVEALQDLYKSLNSPQQLGRWKSDGGDPCEESWTGVACAGSKVIYIKIDNLNLTGNLGNKLSNLHHLKQLDISNNNIHGEIPFSLPLNLTHLNLACNNLSKSIPYSLSSMMNLWHLNLSHNSLSGPLGNVFTGLTYLREMDLSYNQFTRDLPTSFGTLRNLSRLFLQHNGFTGSVIFLADLPLTDLNIQDNNFSGIIPKQFQSIQNLWFGGNSFVKGEGNPPWDFPLENLPDQQNITSPPATESSAIASYSSPESSKHKKKGLGPGKIALMVGGGTLLATCAALFVVIRHQNQARKLRSMDSYEGSRHSLPISMTRATDSPDLPSISFPAIAPRHLPPVRTKVVRVNKRRSFNKKSRVPVGAKLYTVAELRLATNNFNETNLLGEGSLGSVYKAEFPDGQIFAVKNINTVELSLHEEQQFLEVIWNASRLRHPNIIQLHGYCIEHGHHILVYEYVRNISLDHALHSEACMPLSWGIRLRVALGIARGLNYLHSTCMPPVAHSNLTAANVLLDEDLTPRICDCGLDVLKPLTSNSVKLKASEMAICHAAYIVPEHGQPGVDNPKGDIFAFGVLLLELLTGRRPFDLVKPREENSLVQWASSRLHDNESLDQMVDPIIRKTIPPKALSRFADIVSLCTQAEMEFRPPMSEIAESLAHMLEDHRNMRTRTGADASELDPFERSFRSTHSRFLGSPTVSYMSI